jgi:nicotinamidase-related amidase
VFDDGGKDGLPMLMHRDASQLLLIDIQQRLLPAVAEPQQVVDKAIILLKAAGALGVPALISEQYPRGLGFTEPRLRQSADVPVHEKTAFSCWRDQGLNQALARRRDEGRRQAVLGGLEAHVCVGQTALDLQGAGFDVFVVEDAVSSRREESRAAALRRLAQSGCRIVNTEMVVFEWLGDAADPEFRRKTGIQYGRPMRHRRASIRGLSGFGSSGMTARGEGTRAG